MQFHERFLSLINDTAFMPQYMVERPDGVLYAVMNLNPASGIPGATSNGIYKSVDRGLTWTWLYQLTTATAPYVNVWYDRWSGINADVLHIAFTDITTHDTTYIGYDVSTESVVAGPTVVFAGASATSTGGQLSITRARGGNIYVYTMIDAAAEGGFYRSTDAGASFAVRTISEAMATNDRWWLAPGFATDNQDILCVFYDSSVSTLSIKRYDDSANSWAEFNIMTSVTFPANTLNLLGLTVDLVASKVYVIFWNAMDSISAELFFYSHNETSGGALGTDVVSSSGDDQGRCILIREDSTGWLYAYYYGATSGAETFPTQTNIYCKVSKDNGATWGAETKVTITTMSRAFMMYPMWRYRNPGFIHTVDGISSTRIATYLYPLSPSAPSLVIGS